MACTCVTVVGSGPYHRLVLAALPDRLACEQSRLLHAGRAPCRARAATPLQVLAQLAGDVQLERFREEYEKARGIASQPEHASICTR